MHNDAVCEDYYEEGRTLLTPTYFLAFFPIKTLHILNQIRLHSHERTKMNQNFKQLELQLLHTLSSSPVIQPWQPNLSQSESLPRLFHTVKAKFPSPLRPDRWYVVAVRSLPLLVPCLYPQSILNNHFINNDFVPRHPPSSQPPIPQISACSGPS